MDSVPSLGFHAFVLAFKKLEGGNERRLDSKHHLSAIISSSQAAIIRIHVHPCNSCDMRTNKSPKNRVQVFSVL